MVADETYGCRGWNWWAWGLKSGKGADMDFLSVASKAFHCNHGKAYPFWKGVQEKLKKQTKGKELAQSKEVSLFWSGMVESVQVMGSFDGWSHGEYHQQGIPRRREEPLLIV
uniref:Immunoglobulin E-set n=1 Tax=Tanacetum cinerariifolium TaxID=118510 RepID=A0A699J704_TANCI|nr:immunoglobulin E-set [Tanacetum cinerariifolium]